VQTTTTDRQTDAAMEHKRDRTKYGRLINRFSHWTKRTLFVPLTSFRSLLVHLILRTSLITVPIFALTIYHSVGLYLHN